MPTLPTSTDAIAGVPAAHLQGKVTRLSLLRALSAALVVLAVVGGGGGAALFATGSLPSSVLSYWVVGLLAAAFAVLGTVWLHGRFAGTGAPHRPLPGGGDSMLVAGRLQSLLAAAFGVKLAVLVVGVLLLKQFPLPGAELVEGPGSSPKFSHLATFAVTFAAGALLCQLATAFVLARSLRRPADPSSGHTA